MSEDESQPPSERPHHVVLPERIRVRDLAELLRLKPFWILARLMSFNLMMNVNEELDFPLAAEICRGFGVRVTKAE